MCIGWRFRLVLLSCSVQRPISEPSSEGLGLLGSDSELRKDLRMLAMRAWCCVLCYFFGFFFSVEMRGIWWFVQSIGNTQDPCAVRMFKLFTHEFYPVKLVGSCGMRCCEVLSELMLCPFPYYSSVVKPSS